MNTIPIVASEHPVASVVVLKSSKAEVTRTFDVSLKGGRNKLIISKLPTTIEQRSVRVSILNQDGTTTNNAYLSDIVCSVADNIGDDPTKNTIRSLEVKKSGLQSEKKMLDTQAEVMVAYARSLNGNSTSPDVVNAFLDAFGERGKKNIDTVMRIEEQITEIGNRIQEEKRKKNLVKGSVNSQLTAVITADSVARIRFQLTYVVNNTKWDPSYELHAVAGEDGRPSHMVSLHYHASIKQGTGEDWTDASLTLSTVATDTVIKKIPTLEAVKVNIPPQRPTRVWVNRSRSITPPRARRYYSPSPRRARSRSRSRTRSRPRTRSRSPHRYAGPPPIIIQQPAPSTYSPYPTAAPGIHPATSFRVAPDYTSSQEQAIDDAVLALSDNEDGDDGRDANGREGEGLNEMPTRMVTQTPMTLTYGVRGKSDIPSDGKEHIVTITILTFEAEIDYLSVPKVDPRVFLQCRVKNDSEYRLLPGPVSVILDNNYVSRTRLSDINRNDTFTFTLGDDPSIAISYERISNVAQEGTHTFAEPVDIATYTTTITAHNTHPFAIENLTIRDAVPITGNDQRIKVLLRKPLELIEAKEGVFVEVKGEGTALETGTGGSNRSEEESLKVKWEKEQDGLYEYLWRVGADDTAKFETVFEVKTPADLKHSFSNFGI